MAAPITPDTVRRRRKVFAALKANPELNQKEVSKVYGCSFEGSHLKAFREAVRQGLRADDVCGLSAKNLKTLVRGESGKPILLPTVRVLEAQNMKGLETALRALVPFIVGTDIAEIVVTHDYSGDRPEISFKIGRRQMVYEEGRLVAEESAAQ